MNLFFYAILSSFFVYFLFSVKYWLATNRFQTLKSLIFSVYRSAFPSVFLTVVFVLAGHYFFMMVVANVPMFKVPMMFYSYALFNALLVWIPIVGFALWTNFKGYVSHMLPYGAPVGLMLFLPLVEIFSQLIRPLTLTIRFATNLAAGHIMMFMFSYFSVLSSALAPVLFIVLVVLTLMEIFIAFLQSYIFIVLLGLYLEETL